MATGCGWFRGSLHKEFLSPRRLRRHRELIDDVEQFVNRHERVSGSRDACFELSSRGYGHDGAHRTVHFRMDDCRIIRSHTSIPR